MPPFFCPSRFCVPGVAGRRNATVYVCVLRFVASGADAYIYSCIVRASGGDGGKGAPCVRCG